MSYWTSTGPRATQQQQQRQQQRSRVVNSACSDHAVIPKHLSAISSPVIPTHPSVISAHQAPLYQLPGALSCRNPVVSPPPSTLVRRELSSPVDFSLPSGGLSAAPQHPPPEVDQHQQRHHSGRCLSVPMDNTPSESFFSSDSTYFFGAPGTNLEEEESPRSPPQQQQQQHQEEDDEAVDSLLNPLQFFLSSLVDGDDEDDVRPEENRTLSASDDGKSDPVGSSMAAPSYVSVVLRETSGPVENYTSGSTSAGVAQPSAALSSSSRGKHKVCPFFLQGICRYGEHCRYLHEFGSRCPQCGFAVPIDELAQQQHMMQCQEMTLVAEERRASAEVKCGICFDLVVRSGRKFGLLQGCSHAFCLPCIRSWRGSLGQAKETLRACPLCRQDSHFVIPCDRMVFDPERKHDVIERYKERLQHIECKWFNRGRGSCPFGSSCFYAHYNQDGTLAEPERLQHLEHGDGEVEIMKPMRLSDFLE